jgi:hypothetical protein
LPLGKFCFLHFVVLVFTFFSSSLLPPATRISVQTVFPQVCDFFSDSSLSSEISLFFYEKMVLTLERSHKSFGVYVSPSSTLCDTLSCSVLVSETSYFPE